MAYLSETLRQEVIARAYRRCEYCQTQQVVVTQINFLISAHRGMVIFSWVIWDDYSISP